MIEVTVRLRNSSGALGGVVFSEAFGGRAVSEGEINNAAMRGDTEEVLRLAEAVRNSVDYETMLDNLNLLRWGVIDRAMNRKTPITSLDKKRIKSVSFGAFCAGKSCSLLADYVERVIGKKLIEPDADIITSLIFLYKKYPTLLQVEE